MKRRNFVQLGLAAPALAGAQNPRPAESPVERFTAGPVPAVALNHLGFTPSAPKIVIFRASGNPAPKEFMLRDIGQPPKPFRFTRPLQRVSGDLGDCLSGDFSDLDRQALYQVTIGGERSVPFFVRPDVWRRTLPKAVGYYRYQRCGVAVPGVHPACHLDDARRRDTGEHIDVTGGWHDAGDLRKWMDATMMNGFGLGNLARNLGDNWDMNGSGVMPLLDEIRWGNRYFLKMQDRDGLVFAECAGGIGGGESDNHWTDNIVGTDDDRYINPRKTPFIQAMFTALQGLTMQVFRKVDPGYGQVCLAAGLRCWKASKPGGGTRELSWWTLAATELYRASKLDEYRDAAVKLGRELLALQNTEYTGSQKTIRGFWCESAAAGRRPFAQATEGAIPLLAVLALLGAFPGHEDATRWRDALRLHVDEYVAPMTARSAFRIMPFSVYYGTPGPDTYRPLDGELTYRYFLPSSKGWWVGTTSHLESYASALAECAKLFGDAKYLNLAYRQLEWVMGANPFGACLMTGEGMRSPYPLSRYVGLIPGGILNGIGGNTRDEPILDTEYANTYQTVEYWSPHNANYLWAVSVIERDRPLGEEYAPPYGV